MASNDLKGYKIQGIFYLNKRTHRIQQNVGGACPLLALSNTLFLNHQINYNKGGRRIKFQELTDCLTQHLQNMLNSDTNSSGNKVKTELRVTSDNTVNTHTNHLFSVTATDPHTPDSHSHSHSHDIDLSVDIDTTPNKSELKTETEQKETEQKDTEQKDTETLPNTAHTSDHSEEKEMDSKIRQIEECVKLFPKLEEGLDINIKFSDACDFEENPGYRMFSHYGFKIFHGWVIDKTKYTQLWDLIGTKSYDETIDYLVSDPPKEATEEEKTELESNKELIRKFFSEHPTQLTTFGLERLYALMDQNGEDILAIFFRNNHFSTIVKHGGILYEFVTDEGIVDADPQITWQTLSQISGDEEFVNNKFQAIHTNLSQYTQIAQYNRMKLAKDNGTDMKESKDNGNGVCDMNIESDALIGVLNLALSYIDGQSFEHIRRDRDELDNIDPLISHGLTQRMTDCYDRNMCRDYYFGIENIIRVLSDDIGIQCRCFRLNDALSLHFFAKNIEFLHSDSKHGLILEMDSCLPLTERRCQTLLGQNKKIQMSNNVVIGCIVYEWIKFNFWDWRESDWEDYEMDMTMSMSGTNIGQNNRYNRQKSLRESGVRTEYFIHIENVQILSDYCHKGLGSQLLMSLLYAFPSGTKFGVLIPTVNTPAVKCFTKCGFTISRLEQSYGNDTKYKMTMQSQFSNAVYRMWVRTGEMGAKKVKTVTQLTNANREERVSSSEEDIEEELDYGNMAMTHTHNTHVSDDIDEPQHNHGCDSEHDIDIDDTHDTCDIDEDLDESDIHRIDCGDAEQSLMRGMHMQGMAGMDSSNILSGIGTGMGSLFGYHSGNGVNVSVANDTNFLFNSLCELSLMRYHSTFVEFGVNKDALLHLEPSVVEFMISDETDRNVFLSWLTTYKLSQNASTEQTEQPQTHEPTHAYDDDGMGVDDDDDVHDVN